jgi:hypothetical protein
VGDVKAHGGEADSQKAQGDNRPELRRETSHRGDRPHSAQQGRISDGMAGVDARGDRQSSVACRRIKMSKTPRGEPPGGVASDTT